MWTEALVAGPSPRAYGAMAPLGHVAVLFGGLSSDGSTVLSDTWTFDGLSWKQLDVPGPPARAGHAMTALGDTLVLFGGEDENDASFADTWAFDGATWSQLPVTGPSARQAAALATLGHTAVLFGGSYCTPGADYSCQILGDTWTFDGHAWNEAPRGPGNRFLSGMASRTNASFLFGGQTDFGVQEDGGGCPDFSDTWSWDGAAWGKLTVPGPSARDLFNMTTLQDRVVLYGGDTCDGEQSTEMWTFDGAAWSRASTSGPPGRGAMLVTLSR